MKPLNMLFCLAVSLNISASAAEHDIIRLRDGSKILGHADWLNEGRLKVIQLDGSEINLRLSAIENIVFAPVKKLESERPILVTKAGPLMESFGGDPNFGPLPSGMRLAYMCHGLRTMERNSRPFTIGDRSVLYVGFIPDGPSPFVSMDLGELNGTRVIDGQLSESDFGSDGTLFGAKLIYGTGEAEVYANISSQNCIWALAVVDCDHVPTPEEIAATGREILKAAKWRQITVTQ